MINLVGLTPALLGHMPRLGRFAGSGRLARVGHVTPAVTCSVQATYLTGVTPAEHGIVGNGWYDRHDCEIKFWKQSDRLVQRPRIWDIARKRDRDFTCANLFWWYAMYCAADVTVTPRPMYPADGRKIPDLWTHPPELRRQLQARLGQFPLFKFWGPAAGIESSRWIADAAMPFVGMHTLTLVYLPHLDYALQQFGPDAPQSSRAAGEIDQVVGRLLDRAAEVGSRTVVLSEYGIEQVAMPVHINRVLRELGMIHVREELGREILDPGASRAFAVADHQVAHVYVNDPAALPIVAERLRATSGIERVYVGPERDRIGLSHDRSGDIVALADRGAWFTYYYWLDDARAPDFARTVDIHRKPGYDPVELFLDPSRPFVKARVGIKLLQRKLGMRTLLDVIPLDASLVKGSHGRHPAARQAAPLLISSEPHLLPGDDVPATDVRDCVLGHVFD